MPRLPVVAAFDVDGTLTDRDCVVPFLRRVAGSGRLAGGMLARAHRLLPAAVGRDRDRLKAVVTAAAFAGRPVALIEEEGRAFAQQVLAGWLRPDTLGRLNWHREQGHMTVLVSASYEVYLDVVAEHLGIDDVIGTELHVDATGRCTGLLVDGNCRGPEKARRLLAWLEGRVGGRAAVELWAYGDSTGDRELLELADHPVWVNQPLTSVAGTP